MSLNLDSVSVPPEIRDSLKRLGSKFGFTRLASKGANGYTFFGTNLVSQQEIALKYYYWGGEKGYHAEPLHLTRLQSPNIIPILDAAEVGAEWANFVTPFCSNGDLESLIAARTLGVHEAARLCAAVLDGLTYLHGERLLHRDIKPQNHYCPVEVLQMIP